MSEINVNFNRQYIGMSGIKNIFKAGRCVTLLPYSFTREALSDNPIIKLRLEAARKSYPELNLLRERYFEVGRRLVLATPAAFRALNRNIELLQKLQIAFAWKGELDKNALESRGFKVQAFGNTGFFGIHFPNNVEPEDQKKFDASRPEQPESAGLADKPHLAKHLFQAYGILLENPNLIVMPEESRSLHLLMRFCIRDEKYSATRRIIIDSYPYEDIFEFGEGEYLIPKHLLDQNFSLRGWPRIAKLSAVGGAIAVASSRHLPEGSGIFQYPELLKRLLLATPRAFFALSRSEKLLKHLADHLERTGKIDVEALRNFSVRQEGGYAPARFLVDNKMENRYFGIFLNYPYEFKDYSAAVKELKTSRDPRFSHLLSFYRKDQ